MQLQKESIGISLPIIAIPGYFLSNGAIDYGYISESNMIIPFYIKKNKIFRFMLFPVGIIGENTKGEEQLFLDKLVDFIKDNFKVDFILMQHATSLFKAFPKRSKACRFGSYILDLTKTEEDLFAGLHSKHRNVVKKAIKDGILVELEPDNFNDCISLVQDTLKRQGVGIPSVTYFRQLKENLKDNVDFWIVKNGNEIQGAAVIVWSIGQRAYYLYGGSTIKHHNGAMNLLQWEVIKKMKQRGVSSYDFVGARLNPELGSKYEGIQRFKGRFGGELKEGYLWKIPINKPKYKLYFDALKVKCYLKRVNYHGDIIDQEYARIGLK